MYDYNSIISKTILQIKKSRIQSIDEDWKEGMQHAVDSCYFNFGGSSFDNSSRLIQSSKDLSHGMVIRIIVDLFELNGIPASLTKPREKENYYFPETIPKDFASSLSKAITDSLKVIAIIYGTSVFFYLITVIINEYLTLNAFNYVILSGTFDLTKGLFSTILISNELLRSLLIIIFFAFGSLSIHIQIKSIIANTSIKYKNFLYGRIIQIMISIPMFLILYLI